MFDGRRVEQAEAFQFERQLFGRAEVNRREPERLRSSYVFGGVVDENAGLGRQPIALQQDPKNRRVGLLGSDFTGHHDIPEAGKKAKPGASDGERLGRPVAERIERRAARVERLEDADRLVERAAQHVVEIAVIGADMRRVLGETGQQLVFGRVDKLSLVFS